ncbi:MAG: ATP-grasp domain-containing protein [Candidatus Thiodiazotropha taylori]|nr:ATP-grasp domain-containing protein [Candidatus Thiodiazotropha taylori]MCW4252422.1 ATP-grasp domain-containing protein [Candidatus Thiodiazotropha taylori]
MRVFVFEYITGGGMLDSPMPPSLAEEGDMMLMSLLSDLLEINGIEIFVTRDARLGRLNLPVECHLLRGMEDFTAAWVDCLEQADAVWPIAPEFSNVLLHISETVGNQGKLLLNSPPSAVETTSSKSLTSKRLRQQGISVVPTYRFEEGVPDHFGSWVLKPDDGVGCQGIRLCHDRDELFQQLKLMPVGGDYVAQPFIHGTPTSINMLVNQGQALVMSVNHQRIAMTDTGFMLLGCVVNGQLEDKTRFRNLGKAVAAAMPDLWGIIGVDIIDTKEGLQVLEINPRLTTSYVGLRESTGINPAALVFDLLQNKQPLVEDMLNASVVDVNLEFAGAA